MHLKSLSLTNFKNITGATLALSEKLNCFLGGNGMGKSNLLDAVHYLSFCKSFTGAPQQMLVQQGATFAMLRGTYLRRGQQEELLATLGHPRKTFKRGGKEYQRLSQHIGLFPAVLVSPGDSDLATGSAEVRRRFIDMLISQSDARYLQALITYTKALESRNHLLRTATADGALFQALENTMATAAAYISGQRRHYTARLQELHTHYYNMIAGTPAENTAITYTTPLDQDPHGDLRAVLERNRSRDRLLKFTAAGVHRDDLELTLNLMPLRRTASQGQQKTFTLALRLAQYELLSELTAVKPLLLLDDIFDKLDARRVENIMNIVARGNFGQIFITDTNRDHLHEILERTAAPVPHTLFAVTAGTFTPLEA